MSTPEPRPFKDHFSDAAPRYRLHRPVYPRAVVDFLAAVAPSHDLAWDAGCGSGQLSVLLAGRFGRVVATDASAEQIAHAARHPFVAYRVARAEACGLPDRCVDLATAAQAAHWFDLETSYAEVRRVARPGAVIALITYGVFSISPEIDPIVRAFHGGTLRAHWPPERRPVDDGYRSLPFPFPEIDAPVMEMSADWTLHDLIGYVGTWSAVRALERDEGSAPSRRSSATLPRHGATRGCAGGCAGRSV